MTDLDEINIEEHEETRKQFQSILGKKNGITLASWNSGEKMIVPTTQNGPE